MILSMVQQECKKSQLMQNSLKYTVYLCSYKVYLVSQWNLQVAVLTHIALV